MSLHALALVLYLMSLKMAYARLLNRREIQYTVSLIGIHLLSAANKHGGKVHKFKFVLCSEIEQSQFVTIIHQLGEVSINSQPLYFTAGMSTNQRLYS